MLWQLWTGHVMKHKTLWDSFCPKTIFWLQLLLDCNLVFSLNKTYFIRARIGERGLELYIIFSLKPLQSGGRRDRKRVSGGFCNARNVSSSETPARQQGSRHQLCQTSNFNLEAWTIVAVASYCFKALLSAVNNYRAPGRQLRTILSTLLN